MVALPYEPLVPETQHEQEVTQRQATARLIDAFAHPNRLHILQLLRDYHGGLDVQQLEEHLNDQGCSITQPVISHHLCKLHTAGVVGFHKQGLHCYYFIHQDALEAAIAVIAALKEV